MKAPYKYLALAILPTALLLGCQSDSSNNLGPTGQLSVAVTDAPVDDADHVYISFDRAELHHADGDTISIDVDDETAIDLLELQGTEFEFLFENANIPAGQYNWMRLYLNTTNGTDSPSSIVIGGNTYPLDVPGNARTGLKLNRNFTIPEDGFVALTIDFDLRKSVVETSQGAIGGGNPGYHLKPTLRLVENTAIGSISGTVDWTLISNNCGGNADNMAVYLYEGSSVTPDDTDGDQGDALSTAFINVGNTGAYEYQFGFIEAGNYTIAYTCDANLDIPEDDDVITFYDSTDISVAVGQNTEHDFD